MPESDPALGLSDKGEWRAYHVKGNLVASRPRYVREKWGDLGYADVASRLRPPARAIFEGTILPFAWYDFPDMAEIDRAIVAGPMGGNVSKMKAFGSTIARYDLPTLYKVLFKIGTPSFFMKRINAVYSTYIRGGAMATSSVSKDHAVVTQTEGDFPFYFCDQGIPGWFTAAIELSGGRQVRVAQIECVHMGGARCTWDAEWKS
jgi:predicted hydrocarbon binding protein